MSWNYFFRWSCLSVLSGILAGGSASLFLILLDQTTVLRLQNPQIIWALPGAGLLIGLLYYYAGQDFARGNDRLLAEIDRPHHRLPILMAPLILITTLMTHLFGGSTGREGTAVQMGASLSDQLTGFFGLEPSERRALLAAGSGAGFGAAIGAPWAGMVFGIEILRRWDRRSWGVTFWCGVASFVGYGLTLLLQTPHSQFPTVEIPEFDFTFLVALFFAGLIFGTGARLFNQMVFMVEKFFKFIPYSPLRPFFGGIVLLGFFGWEGSLKYSGLGIDVIQQSFAEVATFKDPILKGVATALTVGSGFKGGEFIPLVFIGSTLGSALAVVLPTGSSLLAALGFAAVFGAAAKVPLACAVMAMEIFGWSIGPYALFVGLIASFFSGAQGIYKKH